MIAIGRAWGFLILAGCAAAPNSPEGWAAYEQGDFETARRLFETAGDGRGLGRLCLQRLDLAAARKHGLAPEDLALSHYYGNDFARAADAFERLPGYETFARALRAFKTPLRVQGSGEAKFARTDPLPSVEVRINGRGPYVFAIDTGAGETVVDQRVADELKLPAAGEISGMYRGLKLDAPMTMGRVDRLEVGGAVVEEMPCLIYDLAALQSDAAHGILGVQFLMQFTATLDMSGTLILQPRGTKCEGAEVPMEMVGPHRLVARGKLIEREIVWMIHTGFGRTGMAATFRAFKDAGIGVSSAEEAAKRGEVKVTLVLAKSASLGPITRQFVTGLAGAYPAALEGMHGVRIEGILCQPFFRGRTTFDFDRMRLICSD